MEHPVVELRKDSEYVRKTLRTANTFFYANVAAFATSATIFFHALQQYSPGMDYLFVQASRTGAVAGLFGTVCAYVLHRTRKNSANDRIVVDKRFNTCKKYRNDRLLWSLRYTDAQVCVGKHPLHEYGTVYLTLEDVVEGDISYTFVPIRMTGVEKCYTAATNLLK